MIHWTLCHPLCDLTALWRNTLRTNLLLATGKKYDSGTSINIFFNYFLWHMCCINLYQIWKGPMTIAQEEPVKISYLFADYFLCNRCRLHVVEYTFNSTDNSKIVLYKRCSHRTARILFFCYSQRLLFLLFNDLNSKFSVL